MAKRKYKLGDKVWFISGRMIKKKCKACAGECIVILKDKEKYDCPSCHGSGAIHVWEEQKNIEKGTITCISIFKEENIKTEEYTIQCGDDDYGAVVTDPKNMYKTREKARKAFKKRK